MNYLSRLKKETSNTQTIKNEYIGKSSGYLLHSILDILVDDLSHILMKLRGNLQDIEDAVFDYEIEVIEGNFVNKKRNYNVKDGYISS